MTKTKTAAEGLAALSELFPNSEPCGSSLKITWKELVFLVGNDCDPYDDIEMGPEDLIVDIFPRATWDDYNPRTDLVQVVIDADMAVEMIDGLTDDAPDGRDHSVWAMESALFHFHGCTLDRI